MEEQDKILLSSLRSLGYPIPKTATIENIDYSVLFDSCKYYLQRCGADPSKLPQVDQVKQKYKVTSILVGEMRSFGVQVEVSIFLSPTPPDIRNFYLLLLGKSE